MSNQSDDHKDNGPAYEVGYRKPPAATRFKPGQSGNPKGRRKGSRNIRTFTQEELDRRQWVMVDGKKRLLSNREILVIQQINKARKGDSKAFRTLMEQDEKLVAQTTAQAQRHDLSPEEHKILAGHLTYLRRKD
jgi:hypothetical protein